MQPQPLRVIHGHLLARPGIREFLAVRDTPGLIEKRTSFQLLLLLFVRLVEQLSVLLLVRIKLPQELPVIEAVLGVAGDGISSSLPPILIVQPQLVLVGLELLFGIRQLRIGLGPQGGNVSGRLRARVRAVLRCTGSGVGAILRRVSSVTSGNRGARKVDRRSHWHLRHARRKVIFSVVLRSRWNHRRCGRCAGSSTLRLRLRGSHLSSIRASFLFFQECIAALDAALAAFIPSLNGEQIPRLRIVMLANNEIVMKEMERRGAC